MTSAEKVVRFLSENGYTITTAESCTGGIIASLITDISGSSSVFEGGFVSYSERMKQEMLGVSADLLKREGVYSFDTVEAMAKGAMSRTGANVAVATSGIAGPGGATDKDPVGCVYVCILMNGVLKDGRNISKQILYRRVYSGSRAEVRQKASLDVFANLVEELEL